MKNFFLFIFLFCLLCSVEAQEKPIITVLDFSVSDVPKGEMGAVISLLSSELFQTGEYNLIDIAERDTLLKEIEFSTTDCTDENCQIEIGKMLSAEMIVVGSISRVGTKYILSAKMLQTATSRTTSTADGIYADMDSLVEDISTLARRLSGLEIAGSDNEGQAISTAENKDLQIVNNRITPRKIAAIATLGSGIILGGTGSWLIFNAVKYLNGPVDDSFQIYDSANSNFDSLYGEYLTQYGNYRRKMIIASSVSGGGVALLISSVLLFVLPEKKIESNMPDSLSFLPDSNGFSLSWRVKY